MTREEFQREFNSKTVAYQPRFRRDDRPVVVEVPDGAQSPAGHALLCGLTNQLARAHQRLVLVGDLSQPLLCPDVFAASTLMAATVGVATAINPFIEIDVVERVPHAPALASFSLGPGSGGLQLGCSGWRATTGATAIIGADERDIWGAMLASCLGAWVAFQRLVGESPILNDGYSLWEYARPGQDGPRDFGPLDVGRVLQVGVGGVGAALDYWLALSGIAGNWTLADGDLVDISNLNRQLIFMATDAGYPAGEQKNKAERAATRLGPTATASAHWYGADQDVVDAEYDVVLALANERGVRGALQDRQPPVLLHATTSPSSQAQVHRHIGGLDDCIRCRLPGGAPQLNCSEISLDSRDESDAALPFLSGTAGLLLAVALARLSVGALDQSPRNLAVVDFAGRSPTSQMVRTTCRAECRSWTSSRARQAMAAGTRDERVIRA
jgi:hypothetical protein